jgi:magnesium-transporting ATPase (P-type)
MRRAPRSRHDRLLTPGLLVRAYLLLGSLEAAAAMAAFFFVLAAGGWQVGQELSPNDVLYQQATTACLTAIVLMQVVNVYLCRSRHASVVSRPLFDNSLMTLGIVAEVALILAIDYTGPGNAMFGTAPIGYHAWLVVLPFAVAMLLLEEARKALVRWREGDDLTAVDRSSGTETVATSRT